MAIKSADRTFFFIILAARAVVLSLLLLVAFVLDNAATQSHRLDIRQEWQSRLNNLNLRLQGSILQNVQTVWGLAANVAVQPDITETRFRQLASVIFELGPQLRNIGLAPDLVIRNVYPLAGNESALGLDLTTQGLDSAQLLELQTSRRPLFSGPITLVQGGQGLAARIPIVEKESDRFWGVISVILDLDRLYDTVDLQSFMEGGQLALLKTSALGTDSALFFGEADVEWQQPVETELELPGTRWTLLAQPEHGWPNSPESPLLTRSLLGFTVLLIAAFVYWFTRLLLRDHRMQRRFWGLFQLAPFGIGLYNARNKELIRANNSFENTFGDKARNLTFFNTAQKQTGSANLLERDIEAILERDTRFSGLEGYYPNKSGELTPILLQGLTLDKQNGEPVIWLVTEDISEQKEADRLKNEFISIVSHELRTPLTSIAGSMGLLSNNAAGELPPKASRLAQIAYRNAQQLTILINDLLDIEKLVAGKMAFEMASCKVTEVVHECLESLENFSVEKRVTLKAKHIHDVQVNADRGRLCQALNNLLSNAIKFSPEDSEVTVASEKSENELRIYVSDQGQGIPAEFRERIFQKFSQADSSDQRAKGGTGLGLAITRELMHAMSGDVGFESEEGKGASFWLSLPLTEPAIESATSTAAP
ncbi:ATP-binding protein [Marinobacter salsuginis]|uniref:ATP-binding protein n=1 Tax=Marinobacter salsuginis TaxID=418719 RepID=UPI00273EF2F0|nr:ATP-binding protein [Marinobacter salsuginis]